MEHLKVLPRLLLADLLPKELFERPKWGFGIPLKYWLQKELRHLIDHYLSEELIQKHALINYEEVALLKKKFFAGRDYLYNRLWNLIVLQRWCEQNLTS